MNKHFVNITKKLKLKPTEIVKKNWIGTKTTKILEASNEWRKELILIQAYHVWRINKNYLLSKNQQRIIKLHYSCQNT